MQNIIFNIVAKTGEFIAGMKGAGKATDDTNQKVSGLQSSLNKMAGAVAGAFAVSEIIAFGKEMTKVSAQVESLKIRLEGLYKSEESAINAMADLTLMASKYGIELKSLTENYTQFVSAARASGLEVAKAEKIFKSMTIALAGSGASAEATTRAMTAMVQMLGKNKISAEELRGQLGEAVPQAMGIMAKSLGVTTQQLDKMMASGQLIASEVLPKFAQEMENAFGADASKLATGLQADLNRLENAWTALYLTSANSGLAVGGVKALIASIEFLENAVIGAMAVMGTLLAPFDGGEAMSALMDELDIKEREKYEAEVRAMQERTAQSYIRNAREKGMADKEIRAELLKIADDEERRATNIANVNRKLTQDELNTITEKVERMKAYRKEAEALIEPKKETAGLSEKEAKEIEKQKQAVEKLHRQILLLQADEIKQVRLKAKFKKEDLSQTVGFDKLTDEQKQILIDDVDITAQEQVDAILANRKKNEHKVQESLKKLFEFTPKTRKEIEDANTPAMTEDYKKSLKDKEDKKKAEVDAVKDEEEQKKDIRLDIAMQTFDLLSTLNARYAQSQTRALQEQLNQGLISQEAYEAQMRKIKRKQAIIDKSGALFNIGLNTAVNATQNPALAPLVIAFGALQAATVIAAPIPYNKGTKRVPMMRGAVRGKDSVHAILTPDERVVPADINTMQGYSALMDLAQDRKISDAEAGVIAQIATGGRIGGNNKASNSIDYDLLGKSIAKYIPHTDVSISDKGIAVISERRRNEISRLQSKL